MQKSVQHLEHLNTILARIITLYEGQDVDTIWYFAKGLLERVLVVSTSLTELLPLIEDNLTIEYPVGLALRATLNDYFIIMRAYDIGISGEESGLSEEEVKQRVENFCDGALADGVRTTCDYLRAQRDAGLETKEKVERMFEVMCEQYKRVITKVDKVNMRVELQHELPSVAKLYRLLCASKYFKEWSRPYSDYLTYSRYDHYSLQAQKFMSEPKERKLNRVRRCVRILIVQAQFLLALMARNRPEDEFIKQENENLSTYIFERVRVTDSENEI